MLLRIEQIHLYIPLSRTVPGALKQQNNTAHSGSLYSITEKYLQ